MLRPRTSPTFVRQSAALAGGFLYRRFLFFFFASAQRFFIISEIRLRPSGVIPRRRRRTRRAPVSADVSSTGARRKVNPARVRSRFACAVSAASRSRVCAISRSNPPSAQPINSAELSRRSPDPPLFRPRGIVLSFFAVSPGRLTASSTLPSSPTRGQPRGRSKKPRAG